MKKKIILVSNTSWSLYKFRFSLIKNINKEGYNIISCAINDDLYQSKLNDYSRFVFLNKKKKIKFPIINDLITSINFVFLILKEKPNICLFFTIKPNILFSLICSFLGRTYINNITGLGSIFLLKNKLIRSILLLTYRIVLKKSKLIFFQNNDDHQIFLKNKIVNKSNSKVLPGSGINTQIKQFATFKKNNNENINFIFVARLIKDKGVVEYIKAAKNILNKYNRVTFTIFGNFDYSNPSHIKKDIFFNLIKSSNILYKGFNDNILIEISRSDCLVLPSYREGLSRTLLEAGLLSKPSITSDVPGCKDVIINNYNGLLCKPMDIDDL